MTKDEKGNRGTGYGPCTELTNLTTSSFLLTSFFVYVLYSPEMTDEDDSFKFKVSSLMAENYFTCSHDMEVVHRSRGVWKYVLMPNPGQTIKLENRPIRLNRTRLVRPGLGLYLYISSQQLQSCCQAGLVPE